MKIIRYYSVFIILFISHIVTSYSQMTVQSVNINLVDTFALRGYQNQPVLKIHIKVTGTGGNQSLQRLVVNSLNQLNTDIDSVAIFQTTTNRFSLADYPGEATLITNRLHLTGDSAVFNGMNFPLDTGDNYIWVMMDVDKNAVVSHSLDASIPVNGIKIGGNYYPSSFQTTTGSVNIMQVYFTCNFESENGSSEPVNWTQQITGGGSSPVNWICHYGGYNLPYEAGSPSAPKSGKLNALFARQLSTPITGMLISQPIDLSLSGRPMLTFYHAQVAWCKSVNGQGQCTQSNSDELSVYYRVGTDGNWILLTTYIQPTPNYWVKRQILLPDSVAQDNVYLGFQGTAQYGWGVCLDSIVLYESEKIAEQVDNIIVSKPDTSLVPQNSGNNPVLKFDIRIKGNSGNINLDSLTITSSNTSDPDINPNGVKLYSTIESVYSNPTLIGTPVSITGGKMRFNGLNLPVNAGDNYFWITYDISKNANPGDTINARILAGDIHFSTSGTYPAINQSPVGSDMIVQTIFNDNFSTNKGWTLTGKFQEGKPEGLGGGSGNAGPAYAYIDSTELGTDLSGSGNDQVNLTYKTAYTAISPLIDATYFKNLNLSFYRFLNIGDQDSAVIELQIQGQTNWIQIWTNQRNTITDNKWNYENYNISNFQQLIGYQGDMPIEKTITIDRNKFYLRFRLGSTGPVDEYSGWNIDYLFITGDTIKNDAAVTNYYGPFSSCNLSDTGHIRIAVKNTGPSVISSLPVKFSIDNGNTYTTEIIPGPINVNDTLDYTFKTPANLSSPAFYNIIVRTALPGDSYTLNDSIIQQVTSIPNYSLPYNTNFSDNTSAFWVSGGINSSWLNAWPDGVYINSAPAGNTTCWMTSNEGVYNNNENSYVESPCFSFTGKEVPMFDMQNSYMTGSTVGAVLEYSLDQGSTWRYAPKDTLTTTKWNWYDAPVKTFSDSLGWTGRSINGLNEQEWLQDRQVLPSAIAGQNKVIFRIAFKSDSTNVSEGFAFGDVAIYNAPFDLGVKKFIGLINPGCVNENNTYLKLSVKNYGKRSVHPGDTIILGVKADSLTAVIDTFYMPAGDTLKHLDTIQFRMQKPVHINNPGIHNLSAYVITKTDPYFYRPISYDTAYTTLTVNPNPYPGLPDTVYSAVIDTLVIRATDSVNYTYAWSYPQKAYTTNADSLNVVNTGPGYQYLTITNKITSCHTSDSVYVKILVSDVGVDSIITPVSDCGYGTAYYPTVEIKNFGTDTLKKNKVIPVKLKLDGNTVQTNNIKLNSDFAPKAKIQENVNIPLNLSTAGFHTLKVYTSLSSDTVHSNDTTTSTFQIYGYPVVNLGNNVYEKALQYTINSPSVYNSYVWTPSSPLDTLDYLTVFSSGRYKLTVTDGNNCQGSDSINVHLAIHDLRVKRLVSPVSSCTLPDSSSITFILQNFGTDTIMAGDTASLKYYVNGSSAVYERYTFSKNLLPGDSVSHTFLKKTSISAIATYTIKNTAVLAGDMRPGNDTLVTKVSVFGIPHVSLGDDTTVSSYQYKIDPGSKFKSYLWQDNSSDSVYEITATHYDNNALYTDLYWVTITDNNNCQNTSDTVFIVLEDQDLKDSTVIGPDNSCTLTNNEQISIRVKNTGNITLTNQTVNVSYQINDNNPVLESFKFSGAVGTSVIHTFSTTANLSAQGTYKIFTKIQMEGDVKPDNDTLTKTIQVYGIPTAEFATANDSINVKAWPYTLNAGTGAGNTYTWNNDSTTSSINISSNGWYSVLISNTDGCQGSTTVYVQKSRSAISIAGITIPSDGCNLSSQQSIGLKLANTGNISILNQAVSITYKINSGSLSAQSVTFSGKPNDTLIFYFKQTANMSDTTGSYSINLSCSYPGNADSANSSTVIKVHDYDLPIINFGTSNDTLNPENLPVTLNPGAGFISYEWDNNAGITTPEYSANEPGWYSVKVTDEHHCSNKDSVFVNKGSAINEITGNAILSIYPNPAWDILQVNISLTNGNDNSVIVEMYTSDGTLILNRILNGSNVYHETIEVNTLPKGMYYIRIKQQNWSSVNKVIVL
jgi:hypothetical protein